jgi:hypothetical protein
MTFIRNIQVNLAFEEIQDILHALKPTVQECAELAPDTHAQLREHLKRVLTEANNPPGV